MGGAASVSKNVKSPIFLGEGRVGFPLINAKGNKNSDKLCNFTFFLKVKRTIFRVVFN
jgi:hypothetical protein